MILFLCLILSATYSAIEAVLLSIPIDRARQLANGETAKHRAFRFLLHKSNEILTTILVGNNLANTIIATYTAKMATTFFESESIGLSVAIATILILVFAEILPKTIGRSQSENLAYPAIIFIRINYYIMLPIVSICAILIKLVLGDNAKLTGRLVKKNDIEYLINKAEQENSIDAKQIELLSSILEFPTIKVKDVMIPRVKIGYIDSDMTYTEIVSEIKKDNHSRYPVCTGALENSVGVLHVKDLLQLSLAQIERFDIKKYIKNPFIVYEHMKIQSVFDHMKKKRIHLALVKDENGTVVGMITLEDIIEQIVGDIRDEHDSHEKNKMSDGHEEQMANEGTVVDATISLIDLEYECDIELPNEEGYSTLAGFILDMLGNNFPEEGQMLFWNGLSFEIMKVENGEIKDVRIKDTEGVRHIFSRKNNHE